MENARVLSVNLGRPETGEWTGRVGSSGIRKTATPDPVAVRRDGLVGDSVCDRRDHGSPDNAVYVFAREDLDRWSDELGAALPDGQFGENLTTRGIDVNEALVGERWRVGTALLEVAKVRTACRVFAGFMELSGHDPTGWIKRFTRDGRPGPYLRVLEEGVVQAGDPIVVEHRPDHDVTVAVLFRALTTERDLLPHVLSVPALSETVRSRYAARAPR
ncbi:MOSC domain-containing protein [Nocardioides pantholopis]|uniref:MOSC domain-containing protein n=1 Tax=Nocardioides pantholopis TaxID=2483798 RepID=UPI000F089967|nr:MOSC domain-containing protein [Nocardioides pantholopis]